MTPAVAETVPAPISGTEPETPVVIQEKEPRWPKILAFPLDLPPTVVRGVGLPFSMFANWAEETNLPLRALEFFSNDDRTAYWYPTFRIGGKGGAFFGAGGKHRDLFGRGYSGSALANVSLGLDLDAKLSFTHPHLGNSDVAGGLAATYYRRQLEEYYGIGNDSRAEDSRKFEGRLLYLSAPLGGQWGRHFNWDAAAKYAVLEQDEAFPGDLSGNFPSNELFGLGESISGGDFGFGLRWDDRDFKGAPGKGTVIKGSFNGFVGENDFRFIRTKAAFSRFLTLRKRGRTLGFGGRFEWAATPGGGEIPFTFVPYLGGSGNFRAYDDFRFRDNALFMLISEYRYPLWRYADMALFFESGRVAGSPRDLSFHDLHYSYGAEIRFRTLDIAFFQILIAHGEDGFRATMSLNQSL